MTTAYLNQVMSRGKSLAITARMLLIWMLFISGVAMATGINWPTNQLLPTFSTPAAVLDVIDVSSASDAEADLFASLEGIVNRTQPQIACVSSVDGEGKLTWLDLHNLSYVTTSGYGAILKYRSYLTGLVVTDPSQPDTLNLATTIAGVNNQLICDPSLLATLTNAPYNLPVGQDLRGQFANKYQVYGYLYTNFWPQCTHRIMTGLYTSLHGNLRDYAVAVKSAVVWLDPGTLNFSDKSTLAPYLNDMTANKSLYMGWWPSEGNGLNYIASYGIPVLASDWFRNGSLFSGITAPINIPDIPPPPPLQNKVYVSLILSDGDNIQYMQHVLKMRWGSNVRGSIPIGWTTTPLAAEMDPMMFNYYWSTATTNDCLVSGPSGAGYTHMQNWNSVNMAAYAKLSDPYLRRSGLRVITVWEQVTTGVARAFATNCPSLLGLTDQSGGTYSSVNLGLRTIGLTVTYSSATSDIISGITNAAKSWNGTAPMFLAAQANTWNLTPSDLATIASALDTNKYVLVRPDHLFMLYNRVFGLPRAATESAIVTNAGNATLRGLVTPNATNAFAWMEWGTNQSYGTKTATTAVGLAGATVPLNAVISGLAPQRIYHYRVVASNALGMAWGADRQFTTGGRLKSWGDTFAGLSSASPGLTNVVGISAGGNHGLALENDGTVVAWGSNSTGQTNVPAGLSNVIEVAGGAEHSLALLADGTIGAWGGNTFGQTDVPAGLSNVVAIAAGGYHNLALKADQTITAWGNNVYGQTNVPANLSNVVDVAAGQYHSLALKSDGTVVAWGLNSLGQTNVPAGLNNVIAVAAGQFHSLALKANGNSNPVPVCKWTADSLTGTDSTTISNWMDVVSGRNATQPSVANRPRLFSNVINGHKVVRFASVGSQRLTVSAADSPVSAAGSFTLITVFKTSTPGNVSSSFYFNTGLLGCEQPNIVADWALCLNGSQLGAGLGGGANGCGADLGLYGGSVTDGNPHIAMYVRAGDTISLYVDGVRVATQTSLCPEARGDYAFQIGAMTASSYFFNGDIAEIQIFNRALNPLEITSANESLALNYGISGAAGSVVVWGNSSYGLTSIPKSLTDVSAVAAGSTFNLVIHDGGMVTAWGNNSLGQTNTFGLTNAVAVAGGTIFGLAIGDQPPVAANVMVSGFVDHDLLFTLPVANPDGNPLNYRILSLPPAGSLYQSANGTRGSLIGQTNTLVTDAAGQVVFVPAAGATGNPYATFNFMADDGMYSSGTAQVTINIGQPAVPQFTGLFWDVANPAGESFNLNFSGDSNATYTVWASTNLVDWSKIGPATEANPSQYEFIDATATNSPQRFYRIYSGL